MDTFSQNRYFKTGFVLLIILFTYNSLFSKNELSFRHISVEKGLSQSWVLCIEQDSLGFMWFGTSNGLNKYDGYNFSVFTHNTKLDNSIISNHIQALNFDNNGNLWVGTNVGICLYNYKTNNFIQDESFTKNSSNCLIISNNILYVGTSEGIFIFNITTNQALLELSDTINSQLKNPRISAITKDNRGNIWLGTNEGIYCYNPTNKILLSDIERSGNYTLKDKNISAINIDSKDRVWIGTNEKGLFYIENAIKGLKSKHIHNLKHNTNSKLSISLGRIQALQVDKTNRLLVGIENGGIDIIDLNKFHVSNNVIEHNTKNPSKKNSISNNSVYSIFLDKNNDIWVGTYGGGVNFNNIRGENFNTLSHIHNEPNSLINSIVNVIKKHDNKLWIGTEGGISIIDLAKNKYKHLTHSNKTNNSLSNNAVWSIYFDHNNNAWIGTWAGGLNRLSLENQNFEHFMYNEKDEKSLSADNVFAITEDNNENIWIATLGGGLNKYSPQIKSFEHFDLNIYTENISLINEMRHLYFNSYGELWFSTSISVGYINTNNSSIHNFQRSTNESNNFIGNGAYVIFEDSKGTMWFGTDAGLNYYLRNSRTFKGYSIEDGLPNNSIKSIQEDGRGNIWLGTNQGLIMFKNAIQLPTSPTFKTFDASDGLQGNEFNRRASYKDENGVMYFGGTKGLTYFNPDSIHENTTIPKVVITEILIFNRPVEVSEPNSPLKKNISLTNELTLSYNQSVITLNFSALNYIAAEKNKYAFIMEGFEQEWNYVNNKRSATYTNLNPGTYFFKVKAANNDGFWNHDNPQELKITILPPWYKSRWAFVTYLILLIFSIWLFIFISQKRFKIKEILKVERIQREQEKELTQQRLQFFTNISHEFRTPLTLIYSPIEYIIRNYYHKLPNDVRSQLSTIYKNAHRLSRLATELMDFRKLQFNKLNMKISNQDICLFTKNVTELFKEEAHLNHVELKVSIPEKPVFLWYDQSMIEKVIFNLLSNAFKATPEFGKITIEIETNVRKTKEVDNPNKKWVVVKVSDTGKGLKKQQIEKIFERFYQADNETKTYYSSTGIGLSLAKGLMEKHNGDISVKSTPGKGSEFTIWLKYGNEHFSKEELKKAPKEIIEPELNPLPEFINQVSSNQKSNENISILIIEDNKELRKYLVQELEKYYKVIEAANGKIGLEKAKKQLPDIIVSDVLMPEVDGFEFCKQVKKEESISHIPIILLTARASIEDQIEGTNAGADSYIVKPFNPELLKSKINQLLKTRKELFIKYSANLNVIPEIDEFTNFDKDFLKKVTDYIVNNISKTDLSVEELGEKMHLSRSQLYRKIKSLTGYSATEFIRIIRLEQAKKLITLNNTPINEAGYKVGFGTPSYFSKCYKEYFGISPSNEGN